jgi:ribonuclease P protein component
VGEHAFRPHERLHDDRDYARVFHRQQKAAGRHTVVLVRQRPRPSEREARAPGRLGIMVSTKVSPRAVRRHQLKRWVRELFRRELKLALIGHDVVVLFRRDPPEDGHRDLDRELTELARQALHAQPQPEQRRRRDDSRRKPPAGKREPR